MPSTRHWHRGLRNLLRRAPRAFSFNTQGQANPQTQIPRTPGRKLIRSETHAKADRKRRVIAPRNRCGRHSGRYGCIQRVPAAETLRPPDVNTRMKHEAVQAGRKTREELWLICAGIGVDAEAATEVGSPD
jgi:hypothetical protein